MAQKKKTVDEAIEEVAEKATGGLTGVKDSLAKAQQSMESAKSAMQDAYGKARDRATVAADRTKVYLEDAKKYLGEAREKMGGLAAKSRDQAEGLYAKTKEQYDVLSEKAKDVYGKAVIGDLDRVESVLKVVGYINSADGFESQAKVLNGCTELLAAIFGEEAGVPARSAIAVSVEGWIPCETDMIVKLRA